jgi:hypothetical protein
MIMIPQQRALFTAAFAQRLRWRVNVFGIASPTPSAKQAGVELRVSFAEPSKWSRLVLHATHATLIS